MKRKNLCSTVASYVVLAMLAVMLSSFQTRQSALPIADDGNTVGTLTAYYAVTDLDLGDTHYLKGELICDSNDPINRIVEYDANTYKYEGDESGGEYSYLISKSKVRVETFPMSQLPVRRIGKKTVFRNEFGYELKIFKAGINGHKFYSWNSESYPWQPVYDAETTREHKEMLAMTAEYYNKWADEINKMEIILQVDGDNVAFYHENRYYDGDDASYCRYRKGLIGFLEEAWVNKEGWDGATFSDKGKLLVDQYSVEGNIPEYYSVAYIAEKDAIYFRGSLYYAVK